MNQTSYMSVRWVAVLSIAVAFASGCDALADLAEQLTDAVLDQEPEPAPPAEAEPIEAEPELPEKPASSTARSETEVISFRSILEDRQMSRKERIRAFENLDPAALQKPVAGSNVTGAPQVHSGDRRASKRKPADWEIEAERRRVPVLMYSTAWCGVCKRARAYFEKNRIAFEERDVDKDATARVEYLQLNPRRSVPTIKIGDEVIVGFSPGSVERALNAAALARLN
ncbi:MAG: glutaredoxin family protein [Polyangiales bacterium]